MREMTYYIGATLDGFIAGPNDEVDFFPLSDEFHAFLASDFADALPTHARAAFGVADAPLSRFDTVVMGRRTYEPALALGIADPYAHLRTIVVSASLTDPRAGNVEIVRTEPADRIRELKAEPGLGIYLAGGAALAGELREEIDRLVIKKYPVIAGSGIPLVRHDFAPTAFDLESARTFDNGCVVLSLVRPRN